MSQPDLPQQAVFQQSVARPVSGEELETYGKHAADLYGQGQCSSLNEAVVETVKSAGLSPEQVRRVVEFTNTHAYLTEFKKEGTANKYVVFDGGPAEFNTVLQDLNDGGGGTVTDSGLLDYSHAPGVKQAAARASSAGLEKTASVSNPMDDVLAQAFQVDEKAPPLRFAEPLADVYDARDKLATARDSYTAEISSMEIDLQAVSEELYNHVKQAALSGVPLGHVVQAWHQSLEDVDPELVKSAFAILAPRLQEDVFGSWDVLGASLEKTAGAGLVANDKHPIVVAFDAYCDTVKKLASLRAARDEVLEGHEQLVRFETSVLKHYPEAVR